MEEQTTKIPFEIDWSEKIVEARSFLLIRYDTRNEESIEKELELTHVEDLSSYINAIAKERYDEVFEEYELYEGICHVEFAGFKVRAKNEKGGMFYQLRERQNYAYMTVDASVLNNINKDKMDRIMAIIQE